MNQQNPATPAQAATPGSDAQNGNQPSVVTPSPAANGDQGNSQEGKVTITTKEYRDLQRAKARTLSSEKRAAFQSRTLNQGTNPEENADPELVEKLNQAQAAQQAAERRALQVEARDKVRSLLEKDEFKSLPRSTKDLILKNPALLSTADTLEEAMIDIEEFLQDQVLSIDPPASKGGEEGGPANVETPPSMGGGAPAPASAGDLEDLSKLSGPARSQAAIRNALKKAGRQ